MRMEIGVNDFGVSVMDVESELGKNPFPSDDPKHQIWVVISHAVKEDLAELRSQLLKRDPDDVYAAALDWFTGCFDAAAKMGTLTVWSYQGADSFEAALPSMMEDVLLSAREWCPRYITREGFLRDLQVRLLQRQAHWEKQAQKYARESQTSGLAKRPDTTLEAGETRSAVGHGDSAVPSRTTATKSMSSAQQAAVANCEDRSLGPKAEPGAIPETRVKTGSVGRRHGFKGDTDRHNAIAAIVGRHDGRWESHSRAWRNDSLLKSICADLDQGEIDIPGNRELEKWEDGFAPGNETERLERRFGSRL
jgi:hypothetical protein